VTTVTRVTSVTGVTGWADTFAVTVVVHESLGNPSQPPIAVAEQELTDAFKLLGSQPGFARNQLRHRESKRSQGNATEIVASGIHAGPVTLSGFSYLEVARPSTR
jgi:hypothetical protein